MSRLYPRLLPAEAEARFSNLAQIVARPDVETAVRSARAVYAAAGGRRVERDELLLLRERVVQIAVAHGFPRSADPRTRVSFDRQVARLLHREMDITPGEASQRQVWAYLALVVLPDVCAWRFPPDEETYQIDRFKGTDLTRHTLARVWWRAHLLHDPGHADDPYWMVDVLGEADIDQVLARRRSVAGSPALVRAVVRTVHAERGSGGREVFRDVLKRLLRLTAFLDLDWMDEAQMAPLVMREKEASVAALARLSSHRQAGERVEAGVGRR